MAPPILRPHLHRTFCEGESGGGGEGAAGAGATPKTFTQDEVDTLVQGLKNKNGELINANKKFSAYASIIGDRKPEEIQADLEAAAKGREERQRAEGAFDTMKNELINKHTAEIGNATKRIDHLQNKLFDVHARRAVVAEIANQGGNVDLMEDKILPFVTVKEDETSGDFNTVVVDGKGNPRIGDAKGTPMTIPQLVAEFKENPKYGIAFKPTAASGGGTPGGTQSATTPTTTTGGELLISNADAQDVQKYRAARAEAAKQGKTLRITA
jgi:hypothetical protein